MMQSNRIHHRHQGVVLVISLIFLVILTTVGTLAIKGSTIEEKLAGNSHKRHLLFQAAEAALREGERCIQDNPVVAGEADCEPHDFTTNTNGLYSAGNSPNLQERLDETNSRRYQTTEFELALPPRYFIEQHHRYFNDPSQAISINTYADSDNSGIMIYQIVTEVEISQYARVKLRSSYGKPF